MRALRQLVQTQAFWPEADARDADVGLAGFVEHQLQRVAVEQIDTVVRRILRGGDDLLDNLVVLIDQAGAGVLRVRISNCERLR